MKDRKKIFIVLPILFLTLNFQLNNSFVGQDNASSSKWFFTIVKAEENVERFNITLWVRDWENKTNLGNLKLTIIDPTEKVSSSRLSNATGHVVLSLVNMGTYVITVEKDDRTVGYEKIDVTQNGTYLIKAWAYELNITLVDNNGAALANHTVTIYDQVSRMLFQVGFGNGTQTKFYIGHQYIIKGTEKIYLNGSLTSDYTLDYVTGELIFNAPQANMTEITADYSYWDPVSNKVISAASYFVDTDNSGKQVAQAETDVNGTAHFIGLWNGTYRIKVAGKGVWIDEYILGEHVRRYQEPATGEYVLNLQEPANITLNCIRADIGFNVVSSSNVPIENATVFVRNMSGHLLFKDYTNKTGSIEKKNVYAIDGLYAVSAQLGKRLIGYSLINVTRSETFTVECWTNNLTVTCVNHDGEPLPEHVVLLFDQLTFFAPDNFTVTTNQTGTLVNWTKTDVNGKAYFYDIWNGTYWIRVMSGEIIGEEIRNIQSSEFITIVCNKTYMALRFVTYSGEPLSGATVIVLDAGNPVFRDVTDEDGYIIHKDFYIDNYTVNVEWMSTQVWSGTVDIYKNRYETKQCMVYRLTIRLFDQFGNIMPKADVMIRRRTTRLEIPLIIRITTDENGRVSLLLPYGSYDVSCSYGIYEGSLLINLNGDIERIITCNIKITSWISIVLVVFPLSILTVIMERRRLRIPLKIRKYRDMLSKLESMYNSGLVEYKIYRKLRDEYESKIIELGGREMR